MRSGQNSQNKNKYGSINETPEEERNYLIKSFYIISSFPQTVFLIFCVQTPMEPGNSKLEIVIWNLFMKIWFIKNKANFFIFISKNLGAKCDQSCSGNLTLGELPACDPPASNESLSQGPRNGIFPLLYYKFGFGLSSIVICSKNRTKLTNLSFTSLSQ